MTKDYLSYKLVTMEDFNQLLADFTKYFRDPTSKLIQYLVENNIMTKTAIAKQMGISRETLYNKYLGGQDGRPEIN